MSEDKKKIGMFSRLRLSSLLFLITLFAVLVGTIVPGVMAFKVLYKEKLRDSWSILFLELEATSNRISQYIASPDEQKVIESKIARFNLKNSKIVYKDRPLDGFNLDAMKLVDDIEKNTVFLKSGKKYMVQRNLSNSQFTFSIWQMDLPKMILNLELAEVRGHVYILSNTGDLFYSSSDRITALNVSFRSIVQYFVKESTNKGQKQFSTKAGKEWYGFYSAIPNSNLILFHEISKEKVFKPVSEAANNYALMAIVLVGGILLALWFILESVTLPVKSMVNSLVSRSPEDAFKPIERQGMGEIKILTMAFNQYLSGLEASVVALEASSESSRENRDVFSGLLKPPHDLPRAARFDWNLYQPSESSESPFWYFYHFFPTRQVALILIVETNVKGSENILIKSALQTTMNSLCRQKIEDKLPNFRDGIFSELQSFVRPGVELNLLMLEINSQEQKILLQNFGFEELQISSKFLVHREIDSDQYEAFGPAIDHRADVERCIVEIDMRQKFSVDLPIFRGSSIATEQFAELSKKIAKKTSGEAVTLIRQEFETVGSAEGETLIACLRSGGPNDSRS